MLLERELWSTAPPELRSRQQNWPTVLYSWWCTAFATTIILVRLNGRKVRSGRFFREDWIMIWALVPLWVRMILVHFILIYGTNNIETDGVSLTEQQLYDHSMGARLVLASRIFYAMFIWMSKWTVSEFLKRMTITLWRKSYEMTLQGIRVFLVFTFCAVVVATLAECQPFDHYWQVIPDPGPHCRQGFAQLLTMGTADIITDILLIAFPIPIVLRSGQPWSRKLILTSLFSTSIMLIVITAFRMPEVIASHGRQQYRTVWASSEVIASTFVSNFIIIGSFLRDKGSKRNKYRATSTTDSIDRASTRRPTIVTINNTISTHTIDSDEDLFRSLGCRVPDHLRDPKGDPRPAPMASTSMSSPYSDHTAIDSDRTAVETDPLYRCEAVEDGRGEDSEDDDDENSSSNDSLRKPPIARDLPSPTFSAVSKRNVSFFDVGGLLEAGHDRTPETHSQSSISNTAAHDFAQSESPHGTRRGSRALLVDLGGFLRSEAADGRRAQPSAFAPLASRYRNAPTGIMGPRLQRHDTDVSLQDAGGLLNARQRGLQDVGGLLDDHTMDASAIALQRRLQPTSYPTSAPSSSSIPSSSSTAVYESMELQDPGGLMR